MTCASAASGRRANQQSRLALGFFNDLQTFMDTIELGRCFGLWVSLGRILNQPHLRFIAEHGRAAWQKASGYTIRARAEATIGRFKQVIGDGLRSRTDERRATEVDVAVHALNRMLDFGRPNSVRVA